MTDFSTEACDKYWLDNHDPFLSRVINMLANVEDWTSDGDPALEEATQIIAAALDEIQDFDIKDEKLFVNLLTNIKVNRALRIMQYLDKKKPGSASKLLIYAEVSSKKSNDITGVFMKRNLIFERLQLLARIFAPQRINLVMRALEKTEG